jgi:hypothetical protein
VPLLPECSPSKIVETRDRRTHRDTHPGASRTRAPYVPKKCELAPGWARTRPPPLHGSPRNRSRVCVNHQSLIDLSD